MHGRLNVKCVIPCRLKGTVSDTTTPVTAVADMFIVCSPVDSDDTLLTYGNTPEWNNCHEINTSDRFREKGPNACQ